MPTQILKLVEMPVDVVEANGEGAAIPQIQATETANPKPGVISVLKNRNFVTMWERTDFLPTSG